MAEQSPAITVSHHPTAVLRVINPVVRLLLRLPVGAARKQLMLLSFTGRKTGRQYSIPLTAHRLGNDLYALTDSGWKWNFRGGAQAQVLHDGKTSTMRGELVEDPVVIADLYRRCAQSSPGKDPQRAMGLKFRDGEIPSVEAFTEAVDRLNLAAIRLTPA
ncbi:hypothetical protein [Mycobacterium celatum]|uniref:DUF385 domain-containing protein n=1 Tax=Mycobacterium celatum TaxID=28045 RepID=A0A1X1RMJ3_MYCCE|nr:hypothetical protein [Mycobacterium celatum]ORV09824.1 hypothetical protein AWB95_16440 [Mycobacterium celatum]PIB79633.1 hypothetical protein CQY23_06850 [Mycobacterium celatum]